MLTQILKSPVLNPAGDELGRVEDVIVKLGEGGYPPVTGIKVRIGGHDVFVGMDNIDKLAPGEVQAEQPHAPHGRVPAAPRRGAAGRRRASGVT